MRRKNTVASEDETVSQKGMGKSPTFGNWDKVTVVATVRQTVNLRSPDQSRHPRPGFYKLRPANKTDHLCQSWQ